MPGKSWPMVGRAWGRTNSGTTRKLKGSRVSGIARNASRSSTDGNANPRSQLLPSGSLGHTGVGRREDRSGRANPRARARWFPRPALSDRGKVDVRPRCVPMARATQLMSQHKWIGRFLSPNRFLEPIQKVVESEESTVIHCWAPESKQGGARCGRLNIAAHRI